MCRQIITDCLPWLGLLIGSFVVLRLIVRLNDGRLDLRRLLRLNADQGGSAQSLSFVLTLPIFIMVMMFIVQVSQLMIATVVVHYAAFAAARNAVVWIPARIEDNGEAENCISSYWPDTEILDQRFPQLSAEAEDYGPSSGGVTYRVYEGGSKFDTIRTAAALACLPICPSRNTGSELPSDKSAWADSLVNAYHALIPDSRRNSRTAARLRNKLAYALENTEIEIRFYHPNLEPPLTAYPELTNPRVHDLYEFQSNEIGWQDPIEITVNHRLALLPGPGRLLARRNGDSRSTQDSVSAKIREARNTYTYPLTASAVLGNEGEKSVIPYVQPKPEHAGH